MRKLLGFAFLGGFVYQHFFGLSAFEQVGLAVLGVAFFAALITPTGK